MQSKTKKKKQKHVIFSVISRIQTDVIDLCVIFHPASDEEDARALVGEDFYDRDADDDDDDDDEADDDEDDGDDGNEEGRRPAKLSVSKKGPKEDDDDDDDEADDAADDDRDEDADENDEDDEDDEDEDEDEKDTAAADSDEDGRDQSASKVVVHLHFFFPVSPSCSSWPCSCSFCWTCWLLLTCISFFLSFFLFFSILSFFLSFFLSFPFQKNLFGDAEDDDHDDDDGVAGAQKDEATMSRFEREQQKMQAKIAELEHENVGPKPWQLAGEALAKARPVDSLLQEARGNNQGR